MAKYRDLVVCVRGVTRRSKTERYSVAAVRAAREGQERATRGLSAPMGGQDAEGGSPRVGSARVQAETPAQTKNTQALNQEEEERDCQEESCCYQEETEVEAWREKCSSEKEKCKTESRSKKEVKLLLGDNNLTT